MKKSKVERLLWMQYMLLPEEPSPRTNIWPGGKNGEFTENVEIVNDSETSIV
jgi:hypothetical protein